MNDEATAFADFDLDNILNPGPANADFTDVTIDDIFRDCQKSPEAELRFNGPKISEKDDILFDFVTEPTTSQESLKSSPIVPYNFADRQLRHSNQSAGSYRGVPKSYAELITIAIEQSPRGKLMLSEIYSWMFQNVPEFSDKRLPPSETSWKNSIRHNLSLHDKFQKELNPKSPKSSFWSVSQRSISPCDSGRSSLVSSRRGSAGNLAESIAQFNLIKNPILPAVAEKLQFIQTADCQEKTSFTPNRSRYFRKRSSSQLFPQRLKRRRNTICGVTSFPHSFQAMEQTYLIAHPNHVYPVNACQDVEKAKREFENVSDDQIMLEFCPTLVHLDIFQNLLY